MSDPNWPGGGSYEEHGLSQEEPAFPVHEEPSAEEPASADVAPVEAPPEAEAAAEVPQHAAGELPSGVGVLQGVPDGSRRAVGVVVARFNAEITSRMLEVAMAELDRCGVLRSAVTVMPVPGAYELPIAAMALAKTRRFACIVALGCVIRGETAHFDFVAGEAASGLQLSALETGVPVAFGVLTTDTREQAEARVDRAADSVRTALEMADVFAKLRTAVST